MEDLRTRVATKILDHVSGYYSPEALRGTHVFEKCKLAADAAIAEVREDDAAIAEVREDVRRRAEPFFKINADAEDFLGQAAARLQHLDDLYEGLGVKWGEDPFERIAELRAGKTEVTVSGYFAPLARRPGLWPILAEIVAERDAQDAEWGGPSHDDGHTLGDWKSFIERKLQGAAREEAGSRVLLPSGRLACLATARRRIKQVAALGLAAIESFDRKYPEVREAQRASEQGADG